MAFLSRLNGMYWYRESLLVCFRCLVKLVKSANVFPVMPCRAFPQTYPMWEVRIGFFIWVGCKFRGWCVFCVVVVLRGCKACPPFLYSLSGGIRPRGGGLQAP